MRSTLLWGAVAGMCSIAGLSFGADAPVTMTVGNDPSEDVNQPPDDEPAPLQIFAVKLNSDADSSATKSFADGLTAANRGDFATALLRWRPLAETGDAAAQFNISLLYTNGQGVPQDFSHALWWSLPAAEQGYTPAQFKLGYMYAHGQGTVGSKVRALTWYILSSSEQTAEGKQAIVQRDKLALSADRRGTQIAIEIATRCRTSKSECSRALTGGIAPPPDKNKIRLPVALNSHAATAADYPAASIRRQEQAEIEIVIRIGTNGTVEDCAAVDSKSKLRLAIAACTIAKCWVYTPATVNDEPVPLPWWAGINFALH